MHITEKMTVDERSKYLPIRQKRHVKAKRGERTQLLDEMEEVAGLDRKTVIRRMDGRSGGDVGASSVDERTAQKSTVCCERWLTQP